MRASHSMDRISPAAMAEHYRGLDHQQQQEGPGGPLGGSYDEAEVPYPVKRRLGVGISDHSLPHEQLGGMGSPDGSGGMSKRARYDAGPGVVGVMSGGVQQEGVEEVAQAGVVEGGKGVAGELGEGEGEGAREQQQQQPAHHLSALGQLEQLGGIHLQDALKKIFGKDGPGLQQRQRE